MRRNTRRTRRRREPVPRAHVAPWAEARARAAGDDPFPSHPPPFALETDLLLVAATCPAAPLRAAFPGVPFLAPGGRAVLGLWFSRVRGARFGPGLRRRLGPAEAPADFPYAELNVAALLRGGRLFVPGIYATSELTLRIGRRYGMPKRPARGAYRDGGGRGLARVEAYVEVAGARSGIAARALPGGRLAGALAALALPAWSPPVRFPGGSGIRGRVAGADRTRPAWVTRGRLALPEPWLPRPVPLRGPALHATGVRMVLPPPGP